MQGSLPHLPAFVCLFASVAGKRQGLKDYSVSTGLLLLRDGGKKRTAEKCRLSAVLRCLKSDVA
ncbi:MAG: hypothetical protein C0402_14075 [Thermodesulfovibrio sp.]|nr:hypothetical protein [Thermodesulfovibrio sp.]